MKSVIKRILGTIPVLIGVVLLIYIMLRIVPGNAAAMLLGEHVDQATIDRLTEVMGLDKPVIVQFFDYLAGAIHGDLGISYKYNRAVTDMIIEAFPCWKVASPTVHASSPMFLSPFSRSRLTSVYPFVTSSS